MNTKLNMNTKSSLAVVAMVSTGAALLATATLWADPNGNSHRGGTDIHHYQLREQMQNDGVETNAAGTVTIEQNTQGHADHQQLTLCASGMTTNATYLVLAGTLTDTNLLVIDQVNADARGRVSLSYREFVQGHGHGHGHLGHFLPLPAAVTNLSDLQGIELANVSLQAVLSADFSTPDRLNYLLKRTLTNGVVDATLWLRATPRRADLRLCAKGLTPQTDYWLVLNGGIAETNHTDARGRLAAGFEFDHPLDALNLSTVALWDTSSNVVVSTQLY